MPWWEKQQFWYLSKLTPEQIAEICDANIAIMEAAFLLCKTQCAVCNYPLDPGTPHFASIHINGNVCDVCHDMEYALINPQNAQVKRWFVMVHQQWEAEQGKKKDIIKNKDNGIT